LRVAVPLIAALVVLMPGASWGIPPVAESEPNSSSSVASALPGGQCYVVGTGAISPVGDQDFWSFPGTAGASVWAYVDPEASTDPFLEILQPDGATVIEHDDNDGMGNGGGPVVDVPPPAPNAAAVAGAALTSSGTHFARVTETGNDGTINRYRLFLAVSTATVPEGPEPNNTDETAGVITACPEVRVGQIEAAPGAAREWDCYTVHLTAGETLFVAATGPEGLVVSLRSSCGDAPTNRVVNAQITAFAATPPGIAYSFNATSSATYSVRVREGAGGEQGPYRLMVAKCNLTAASCPATDRPGAKGQDRCAGRTATHVGTNGNDEILGTNGKDVVLALGGNDVVKSRDGNDVVCGGAGNDRLRMGNSEKGGVDMAFGQGGRDKLFGQGGRDVLRGGAKKDLIKAGSGKDRLLGQGGNDNLRGQGGSDQLNGGPGIDRCVQGAGSGPEISCER
jgi:RTX calcium-binding nonapeptide repeat (4 copies)